MIDIQAKIRHQALSNAAALKEVGEFVERISKKDEETKQAAETFDVSTVKMPSVRCYEIPLEEENSGLHTAEDYKAVGNKLFGEKKFEKALNYYECAGRLDPKMAAAFGNAGLCYQKLKRDDEALAAFSRAIEIDAQYAKILVRRGRLYIERGNYAAAHSDLALAVTLLPEKSRAEVMEDLVTAQNEISKNQLSDAQRSVQSSRPKGKSITIDMSSLNDVAVESSPPRPPIASPPRPSAVVLRNTKQNIPSNCGKPSIPPVPTSEFTLYSDICHLGEYPDVLADYLNSFHSAVFESYLSSQLTDKELRSIVRALNLHILSAKKTINTLYALIRLPNLHLLSPFLSEDTKESIRSTVAWALHQIPENQAQVYHVRNDEIREAFCL